MILNERKYIGFCEGKYLETGKITIPADHVAVNRGYGAFEFFGIINRKPFYFERHMERFFRTLRTLRLGISYSQSEILEIVSRIIELNAIDNFYLKIFVYPADNVDSEIIAGNLYMIPVEVSGYSAELYSNGAVLISKEFSRFLPEAKSTGYLALIYWQNEITRKGATDVLYYSDGRISETSRGNVFMVKNNVVYSPGSGILKGITRSVVIDICMKHNISVVEEDISLQRLFEADEVFLSSTTKEVMPVTRIDEKVIGSGLPGTLTCLIRSDFEELRRNW